jgi:hypothetical protein
MYKTVLLFLILFSFEDYKEDISKLSKMAEQVEFTIIREAIRHKRLERQNEVNI